MPDTNPGPSSVEIMLLIKLPPVTEIYPDGFYVWNSSDDSFFQVNPETGLITDETGAELKPEDLLAIAKSAAAAYQFVTKGERSG